MPRNLVLLFDGIRSSGPDDGQQPVFYDEGVGTKWWNRLSGGIFGRGLSENIQEGYAWLSRRHVPGDAIYVFGFSRGAYTARSLVGLIRKCGLLNSVTAESVKQAYELYREKSVHPDDPKAVEFRAKHARETRVRYVGVWDTVGALGIPISQVPFSRDFYQWHDTELSKIVDYAIQAVAADEHRKDFGVTLWSKLKPENVKVEQRWFAGAHSDIGGGEGGTLPNLALRWLQDTAEEAGLALQSRADVTAQDALGSISDSFASFMFGIYRFFKKRYYRTFGAGVNEVVDESVWQRWRADPNYRPPSLASHPQRPMP